MIETIRAHGFDDERVLAAMAAIDRAAFVPESQRSRAYNDHPLPIGQRQTISQPYIVALMTHLAQVGPGSRVLEVGTGSGYQAAVLAQMGAEVYSIEIIPELAATAKATLEATGFSRIQLRTGDGYAGWPEAAPFDAIVVTAAPPAIPEPLKQQLRDGGRLVVPVGTRLQTLERLTRKGDSFARERIAGVRFVPMTGVAQQK